MKMPILIWVFMVFIHSGCKSKPPTTTTPSTTTTTRTTTTTVYSPTFATDPRTFVVNEGNNITLPCYVDDLGGLQIIWERANKTLAVGDTVYEEDGNRVHVQNRENGSTIVIREAEEKDAGEYVCKVGAVELKHTVQIIVRPEVEPDPKSGVVTVKEGEPATLSCKVTRGNPEMAINWELESVRCARYYNWSLYKTCQGYPIFWFGLSNIIPEARRWSSGVYRCKANNGWPEPATAEIRLEVQHTPILSLTPSLDYTRYWTELMLMCSITASPLATVEWYKDGQMIEVEEDVTTGEEQVTHRLHLKEMGQGYNNKNETWVLDQDRLGLYECRARNMMGEASGAMEIISSCDRDGQVQCFKRVKEIEKLVPAQLVNNTEVNNEEED
eukprot:GFUD01101061.1.p1 GENE.GFUD01101061.1~~GFUD01101061.1.p1  ORF type:complete len:406 (-),score=87.89 GFUD01101061.1:78-1232(-)